MFRKQYPPNVVLMVAAMCLVTGVMFGLMIPWEDRPESEPAVITERLVPIKIIDTWKYSRGGGSGRTIEVIATGQRFNIDGPWGKPGDEYTIDPKEIKGYRPLLPPEE